MYVIIVSILLSSINFSMELVICIQHCSFFLLPWVKNVIYILLWWSFGLSNSLNEQSLLFTLKKSYDNQFKKYLMNQKYNFSKINRCYNNYRQSMSIYIVPSFKVGCNAGWIILLFLNHYLSYACMHACMFWCAKRWQPAHIHLQLKNPISMFIMHNKLTHTL